MIIVPTINGKNHTHDFDHSDSEKEIMIRPNPTTREFSQCNDTTPSMIGTGNFVE